MLRKSLFTCLIIGVAHSYAQNTSVSDTLKLYINEQNTIYVKSVFNRTDTLNLNFDTGTTELVLTTDVLNHKIKEEIKLYNTLYSLVIGKHQYLTKVYDAQLTGHGTDGRFGWDLFNDAVVEINYNKGLLVIHRQLPNAVKADSSFVKLPITFEEGLPFIKAVISQDSTTLNGNFLFDTGYQRTAMLDNDILKENNFPLQNMREIKRVVMRGAQGNEVPVVTLNLDLLKIGSYELKNVPVQQITGSKPMKGHNIHILGNEILKRFNTFLDFKNGLVYLKASRFYDMAYIEQKKG